MVTCSWLHIIHRGNCMNSILHGDALSMLRALPDQSIHYCVTSPPYWGLRDYGIDGQLGLEQTPEQYTQSLVDVFHEVRRILRDDGTLWLNLGDSYAGGGGYCPDAPSNQSGSKSSMAAGRGGAKTKGIKIVSGLKSKDLVGIPWRVAFALQGDGWYLRSDIIWHKPNAMPESVRDRPTKSHEYIFLLSKSPKYYYDHESIKEPAVNGGPNQPRGSKGVISEVNGGPRKQDDVGKRTYTGFNERYTSVTKRNKRTVWTVTTKPFKGAHFATFPPDLIEPCVLAGCPEGGIVLDPFFGAGTTGLVALQNGRKYIGIELNQEYIDIAHQRLNGVQRKII